MPTSDRKLSLTIKNNLPREQDRITKLCSLVQFPSHSQSDKQFTFLVKSHMHSVQSQTPTLRTFWHASLLQTRTSEEKLSLCFKKALRHGGVLESECIAPCILDLGTSGQLHPQRKSPCYAFDRRLGGP
jgi:hypothetical protein